MSAVKKTLMRQKIMQMRDLPTIPAHVQNLMRMLRDQNANIDDVFVAINQDMSLVARIMKLVNSSFYSLPVEVETVEHAVSLVGFKNVWELVMSSSVMDIISSREKTLWEHSYSTSLLVQEIIKEEKINCSKKLPLTMLMHDIGKLVLINFNKTTYKLVQQISADSNVLSHTVEEKHLGVTHMEVGSWLLESWEMDEEQTFPLLWHHTRKAPEKYATEIAVMAVADYCDNMARRLPSEEPSMLLLAAGGIQEISLPVWMSFQRQQIKNMAGSTVFA